MQFTKADADLIYRALEWRRDVRHFRDEPVDDVVLHRLSRAMDYAPSVGNARPWRVLQLRDSGLRAAVRANYERANAQAALSYDAERKTEYSRLKLAGLDRAPVQLAVFTVIDPCEGHGLGRHSLAVTLQQSTAMAIHALWLAARSENLGVGLVSILDPRAMEVLLAVPSNWQIAAYICLGHPEFADDMPLLHAQIGKRISNVIGRSGSASASIGVARMPESKGLS